MDGSNDCSDKDLMSELSHQSNQIAKPQRLQVGREMIYNWEVGGHQREFIRVHNDVLSSRSCALIFKCDVWSDVSEGGYTLCISNININSNLYNV